MAILSQEIGPSRERGFLIAIDVSIDTGVAALSFGTQRYTAASESERWLFAVKTANSSLAVRKTFTVS